MLQPLESKRAKSGRFFESDKLKNNTNEGKRKRRKGTSKVEERRRS